MSGEIDDIRREVRVEPPWCSGECGKRVAPQVKVDFSFTNLATKETEWAEAKGVRFQRWIEFETWWRANGPGILHVYTDGGRGRMRIETIKPESYGTEIVGK